jgi:glycogen synthase
MRILLILSLYYPHCGGMSSHINTLSNELKRKGEKIRILSLSSFPLPIRALLIVISFVFDHFKKGLGVFLRNVLLEQILGFVVFYFCFTKKIDIIHAHDCIALNSTWFSRYFLKTPTVLTVHGYLTNEPLAHGDLDKKAYSLRRLFMKEELRAYKNSDRIIAVDTRIKKHILKFISDSSKVINMCNFVNPSELSVNFSKEYCRELFGFPSDKFIALIPRRLVEKCGVILPLQALLKMPEPFRNRILLVYCGSGPKKIEIETFVRENQLKNVLLLGPLLHEEMKYVYKSSDLVLIPSIHVMGVEEATSISALEAMAIGIPVIASNIGGLTEIIENGVNGFLIEPQPEELANTLCKFIDSQIFLQHLNASQSAEEGLIRSIQKIHSIYKDVLTSPKCT